MLIQITNRCNMNCIHCMQECTSDNQPEMPYKSFTQAVDLSVKLGCKVLAISGGEPTLHNKWVEMVSYACEHMHTVSLVTNGWWLVWHRHESRCKTELVKLLQKYNNLLVQVTSIKGLYFSDIGHLTPEAIVEGSNEFKNQLKSLGIKRKFYIVTDRKEISMTSLGRAAKNPELLEEAKNARDKTTDCLRGCLAGAQAPLPFAIQLLEEHGKFCTPRINCKGEIGWAECWTCPGFATIDDPLEIIFMNSRTWRPCGKCADYKKLLDASTDQYIKARQILNITKK